MQFRLLLTLLSAGITLANIGKRELICNHDNCLRALIATQKGPAHSSMVATDCSKFLATAAPLPTHPPAQVKRGVSAIGLPLYASACSNPVRYESACACVGVFPASVTVYVAATTTSMYSSMSMYSSKSMPSSISMYSMTGTSISGTGPSISAVPSSYSWTNSTSSYAPTSSGSANSTSSSAPSSTSSSAAASSISSSAAPSSSSSAAPSSTSSSASSSTSSSAAPTCTNTITDPMNCGSCGTVCPSGICENGSCTTSQCSAQTCGGFSNCDGNTNCFCFSSTHAAPNNGFCGSNAVCTNLTPCAGDTDCNVVGSTGNICAINTCCPPQSSTQPGVCLQGQCGNPSAKLMMLAKARRLAGRTAAF